MFEDNPEFDLLGLFEIYDRNHDGTLKISELQFLVKDMGIKATNKDIDVLIEYFNNYYNEEHKGNEVIHFLDFV